VTRLLALDSSTEALAVAVACGDQRWTRVVEGGVQASARMLPLALQGLAACGLQVSQLDAVAFAAGPGAFTGLRCACAVAQGLAYAARIPVLPLDSLMVVAEDARRALPLPDAQPLWVAMDARMDEVYAACYRFEGIENHEGHAHRGSGWQVEAPPALYTLDALASRWRAQPPAVVVGSAVQAFAGRLPWGAARTHAEAADRAAALLALALQQHARGVAVPAAQAAPLYLRDKVALTTAERDAARAAQAARDGA
jgi:tRNA threonylcarbamoyladenosine biosynthesis protein TsaB